MRVLFINPSSAPALNMGLTYVMSAVEKENEIKLLDLGLYGKRDQWMISEYLQKTVDVVAFSTFTHNFEKARQTASFIKQRYPRLKIIFGGIHPTLCPDEVINRPEIDAICIGEGENALKEYLASLQNGKEPSVDGIWFKDRKNNIIRNPVRPFQEDIDSLRFPNWDHWDMEYYLKDLDEKMGIISSRGCPYSCSFCSNPVLRKIISGNYFRIRDPEQVIAEIELNIHKYRKYGYEYIKFDDEVFGLDWEFLKKFCNLYISRGLHKQFAWLCQTRADLLTNEYVDLIAESGCAAVGLGIETGDEYTRSKIYKKNISNDTIIKATARLRKRNISYVFYMIYNAPYANRLERRKTIKIVKDLNPLRVNFSAFMYLPKTELSINLDLETAKKLLNYQKAYGGIYSENNKFISLIFLFYRLQNSFRSGLKLRGLRFISDLIKFIYIWLFQRKGKAFSSTGFQRAMFQLEYFTLFKYAISNSRKNLK
jgi:anaerobic magnesium-protoporphyrin IX monomethyl ester cyclase